MKVSLQIEFIYNALQNINKILIYVKHGPLLKNNPLLKDTTDHV